jgi:hypothetical protein
MSMPRKIYRYQTDREEAERPGQKFGLDLPGVGEIPISIAEHSSEYVRLTGRQALALLRLLERNRATFEQEAEAERDREYGHGPGPAWEVPRKIRRGDPRIGKRAVSYGPQQLDGKVTAILRYSNGVEQIEIKQLIYAQDSPLPGTATACIHADDVDILDD